MHAGYHQAGWRHPDAESGGENFDLLRRIAQKAEQACFDMMFFADVPGSDETSTPSVITRFEPLTMLSALSMVTSHIGLAATASTTYHEPMNLARMFASLDHLSGGRAAWNAVTTLSKEAAGNFGATEQMPHAERYERANEFVEVVRGLWDSWEDDAFPRDKTSGVYFDRSKLHRLDYKGQRLSVRGPLNIDRPPQGYPVTIVAGASGPGRELAARFADISFTAQFDLGSAQAFYLEVKSLAAAAGRDPSHVLVMPGLVPVIGATEELAHQKFDELQQHVSIEEALHLLSFFIGHDMSSADLDQPLPMLSTSESMQSRTELLSDFARRNDLTVRQLAKLVAAARGHLLVVGTPAQVADVIQEWFEARGADGFNILPPYFPGGLDDFADKVVPLLQQRGIFRTEYEGVTLRDNLGLPKPPNRYTAA